MSTAADRMRTKRARDAAGQQIFRVCINVDRLAVALGADRFLQDWDHSYDDHPAIEASLQRMVEIYVFAQLGPAPDEDDDDDVTP